LKPYQDDRDTFYLRHNIKPRQNGHPVPAVPADNMIKETDTDTLPDDTWFPIEIILSYKKVAEKVFYRVKWLDSTGSRSWVPAENVTQYATDEHFVQKRSKSKQRRKRPG